MSSFLKRITNPSKLNVPSFANMSFELDEPDFSLVQKFNYSFSKPSKTKKRTIKVCRTCGNTEFSYKSRFCKICGSEVENLF